MISLKQSRNSFRNVGDFLARLKGEVSNKLPWKDRDDTLTDGNYIEVETSHLSDEELRVFWFGENIPGVVGLRNHGNTCFINAVLQCLSHTDTFAEYFATEKYKVDLMQRNRLKSKKFGTQGEVTEKLAEVIKAVWSCQYTQAITTEFKSTIDKYGSQYRGSTQHDAQEFLLWLLDKVHEDLNVAKKQKYKRLKSSNDRPDEVVAAESMANFLRCNESFVQGLFQAQFRSSLTCPHCQRQSNTFDPFLCLSLPIPQSPRRPIFVAVVYLRQQPRQVRLAFSMDCAASVGDLRHVISTDAGVCSDQLVLVEIDGEGFHRTFFDEQPLSAIDSGDLVHSLYAIEMPEQPEKTADEGESVSMIFVNVVALGKTGSKRIDEETKGEHGALANEGSEKTGVADTERTKCDGEGTQTRFGAPYVTQMRRETCYVDFQKLLLKEMHMMVHPSVLCGEQEVPLFDVELYLGEKDCQLLRVDFDMPLYAEAVDQALSLSDPDGDGHAGPKHIKLLLKWDLGPKEKIIFDDVEHEDEHESVKELREDPNYHPPVQLEHCFDEYTSEEILGQDDAWLCPSCNRREKGVKRLGLWSLPDILIVHLKRFKQSAVKGVIPTKLTTLVEFPMTDFNISDHLVKHESSPRRSSNIEASAGSSSSSASTPGDENGVAGFDLVLSRASRTLSVMSEWPKAILGRNKRQSLPVKTSHPSLLKPEECSYSLYAVCNHHGSDDQGGHYTAFCRNSNNGLWYCFDDQHVTRVDEAELVTKDAYILFYQRKTKASRQQYGSPSVSVGGSSTLPHSFPFPSSLGRFAAGGGGGCGGKAGDRLSGTLPASWQFRHHHWVYCIPGLKPVGAVTDREGTTNTTGGSNSEEDAGKEKNKSSSRAAFARPDVYLASSESMSDPDEERGSKTSSVSEDTAEVKDRTTSAQNAGEEKSDGS